MPPSVAGSRGRLLHGRRPQHHRQLGHLHFLWRSEV